MPSGINSDYGFLLISIESGDIHRFTVSLLQLRVLFSILIMN